MTSYVVRNGRIQKRQKDFNTPNYRIIPYKSTINATTNDYFSNTITQLQKQLQNVKNDYRNVVQTMWKILSQIDRTSYDNNVAFNNLKIQEIYDKISLIRSLNAYEPEEESLKFSAINKIDDNSTIYPGQSNVNINSSQMQNTFNQVPSNNQSKKQSVLYQIQQQQECMSNASKYQQSNNNFQQHIIRRKQSQKSSTNQQPHQQDLSSKQQENIPYHRRTLSELSAHKCQNRRTSFLLKQKISIAFHEQQQLRQILQQQLQKLTQQIDTKNQYLNWTVDELKIRNQLIEKLKDILIKRDQEFQRQESQLSVEQNDIFNNVGIKKSEQILQQIDRQVGVLINSLIQRTEQTFEDFQFLTKSLNMPESQGYSNKAIKNGEQKENKQECVQNSNNEMNQSIYLDQFINQLMKEQKINNQTQRKVNIPQNQPSQSQKQSIIQSQKRQQSELANPINSSIQVQTQQQESKQQQLQNSKKSSIIQQIINQQQGQQDERQNLYDDSFNLNINSNDNINQTQNCQLQNEEQSSVLQPKKMDFNNCNSDHNQDTNIVLLTKQHFLRAEKLQQQQQNQCKSPFTIKKQNSPSKFIIQNVKMVQSLKGDNSQNVCTEDK